MINPIIRKNVRSGWPRAALPSINRKVGALTRNCFHMKVGITANPERRWRQSYRDDGWKAMHILYESTCHDHVCQLERNLVKRLFDRDAYLRYWYYNWVAGGGGRKPFGDRFYLYLVTAPKWARASRREW